ncbi:Protein fam49a [Globomyces sp. JEL0801]|nr:Protein fam49a [Globomyces sp. JEL0801]
MGIILSILKGGSNESDPIDIPVNFDAKPTADESDLHGKVLQLESTFLDILKSIESYTGCGDQIRAAISTPSKENDELCWNAILPAVSKLKDYYEFAQQLELLFPKIIGFLCADEPTKSFEKYQATAYHTAVILNFAIQFDLLKAANGSIVSDELANRMSLFFAHSNPVSKALIDTITAATSMKTIKLDRAVDCFAILAGISYNMVAKQKTQSHGDLMFLRVMVAGILFYDHIDPVGVFVKESNINIKSSVKVIQTYGGAQAEPLLNVVKFSTLHLNNETTPKATKALLS